MIDVATAQEIVNFVGQLMPQRGHATLKAANEALDNISETSDTENVDLEGPFRDLPIPSDMDERDVAVNRQDNLLQYGVRRLAFVQCLTGAEIPEENLNNVFTPEGSNAYLVLKVYSHSIERNAISFGALCPRTLSLEPAKNLKHSPFRFKCYHRFKISDGDEQKKVMKDYLMATSLTRKEAEDAEADENNP